MSFIPAHVDDGMTYTESVSSVLDEDVPDPSVAVKEPLDVPLPDVVRQIADKDPGALARRHR